MRHSQGAGPRIPALVLHIPALVLHIPEPVLHIPELVLHIPELVPEQLAQHTLELVSRQQAVRTRPSPFP